MNKVLIISTQETWVTNLSELTTVEYNPQKKSNSVVLYKAGDSGIGYITVSSDQEAKWFATRLFANMDNDLHFIMDYTSGICTSIRNLNTVNDILKELEIESKQFTATTPISPEKLTNIKTAIQSLNIKDE